MSLRLGINDEPEPELFNDDDNLLSPEKKDLLQRCASNPFNFGKFKSLEDILTQLGVKIYIEPDTPKRLIPVYFNAAIEYWKNEMKRLRGQLDSDELTQDDRRNLEEKISEAGRNIEDIYQEKEMWLTMSLRGLYDPIDNVIKLFPKAMKQEYGETKMDELLVSTLAHETMHAYFNRYERKKLPYIPLVEEPLAEFGMLLYLHETCDISYFDWAYHDVASKKTCYKYGARLMDQYLNGDFQLRKYLEDYKIDIDKYSMPTLGKAMDGRTIITMPGKVGGKRQSVNINGHPVSATWHDVFKYPPRYFYNPSTKTLGLDGEWGHMRPRVSNNLFNHNVDVLVDVDVYVHNDEGTVDNIYLGDNFFCEHHYHGFLSVATVIVSPKNKMFTVINGIPMFKKNNEPALPTCGDGYYELRRKGKWGVVDAQLNQIVPFKYDCVWSFDKNGLFMVRNNSQYGLVNNQGKEQIPVIYDDISENDDGTYTVEQNGKEFKIDISGNVVP